RFYGCVSSGCNYWLDNDRGAVVLDETYEQNEPHKSCYRIGRAAPSSGVVDASHGHRWVWWHVRGVYLYLLDDDAACRLRPLVDVAGANGLWGRFGGRNLVWGAAGGSECGIWHAFCVGGDRCGVGDVVLHLSELRAGC